VSAITLVCAVAFAAMLTTTVAIQTRRVSWAKRLKRYDICGYFPIWTLFAPVPKMEDTRILWREQLLDGTIGPWHEMVAPQGGILRALWHPTKRSRRAVETCASIAVHRAARNRRSVLPMLDLPYLMIVQHMTGCQDSVLGVARQFAVLDTQGADIEDRAFRLMFVSHWHQMPASGTDLRVPITDLPEMRVPAEQLTQRAVPTARSA